MIVAPLRPLPALCASRTGKLSTAATNAAPRNATSFLRMYRILCLARRPRNPASGDVAELDRVREGAELLQALVLDLPNALPGDVEGAADLVEGARMLPVQPVAELEHLALAARERAEDLPQRLLAERGLGLLVGKRQVLVGDEVAELRLVLVADGLLERDRCLRAAADVLDLVGGEVEITADFRRGGLASELRAELALGAHDLVELLDHVDGHADRAGLVRERTRDRLADPPRGVGRELEAFAVVELLRRANEADRPLLDQIEEGQALVAVLLGDRDDEAQIRLDHLLLRAVIAALDALRQLDLLRGGEEVDLADVLEKELQRVGRDLARLFGWRLVFLVRAGDDLDLELFERVVEVVDLSRLEIELVERERDLVGAQVPVDLSDLEERLRVVRLQEVDNGLRWCGHLLGCAHSVPPSWTGVATMPHCASWPGRAL